MNKLAAFVRLDFVTVKPYLTFKNLLIYVAMAAFLTTMSENVASGVGVGMMLGILFGGYPFAVSEKNNMDALYATLSVDRKTVVRGRYVFTLLLDALAILISVGLGTAGTFLLNAYRGTGGIPAGTVELSLALTAFFLLSQSIQLPVYFKFGYTKARILSVLPVAAITAGYSVILGLRGKTPVFLVNIFNSDLAVPALIAALLLFVFASYRLSLALYKKRDF